jgi:hypothetical protein
MVWLIPDCSGDSRIKFAKNELTAIKSFVKGALGVSECNAMVFQGGDYRTGTGDRRHQGVPPGTHPPASGLTTSRRETGRDREKRHEDTNA